MRIFHTVENHDERRLSLPAGRLKNVFCAAVRFGSDQRNDALMVPLWDQAIEGRRRLDVHRDLLGLGLFHEIGKLPIGPLDEKTL
jgi:hypothetical protein